MTTATDYRRKADDYRKQEQASRLAASEATNPTRKRLAEGVADKYRQLSYLMDGKAEDIERKGIPDESG